MAHVSTSPPLIPDGRVSRVRLAAAAFPEGPSRPARGSSACTHTPLGCSVIPSARRRSRSDALPGSESRRSLVMPSATCREPTLPKASVTCPRETSRASSAGIARPSSLVLAHAPHQMPPTGFAKCSSGWSSQVAASPCWQVVDPDVISAICVWALGPIPRRAFPVLARFFLESFGLHPTSKGLARETPPRRDFYAGNYFRGCSHSLMFRLPHLLGPRVTPTAGFGGTRVPTQPMAAGPFTPRNAREVAYLELRHRYMSESGN